MAPEGAVDSGRDISFPRLRNAALRTADGRTHACAAARLCSWTQSTRGLRLRTYASSAHSTVSTYSRKNKLYFAFRELGRVVRTTFLLQYVSDLELRQLIQAATNKSEAFNKFVQ